MFTRAPVGFSRGKDGKKYLYNLKKNGNVHVQPRVKMQMPERGRHDVPPIESSSNQIEVVFNLYRYFSTA